MTAGSSRDGTGAGGDNYIGQEATVHDEYMDYPSVEQLFESREVPAWKDQITVRAMVVSLVVGVFLSFIVMDLNLTTGIIPSLNVSAGLLGFFLVKIWTKLLERLGILQRPFTRQENTVIQTCVVACSGIAFSGGFGSHLLGMSKKVTSAMGEPINQVNVKDPSIGWMVAFLFTVSFVGLFSVLPLRKIMILGYKLTYPSGTATAHLINSFHTPPGAQLAKKQVSLMFKSFAGSFLWSCFRWFYSAGDDCGFGSFPTFGLKAYENKFYFDFSATYVGVGMICPHMVNISLLIGSVISWGILWPYIRSKKGEWYSASLPDTSLHGLNGYQVFIAISLILGDGSFHFFAIMYKTWNDMRAKKKEQEQGGPLTDRPTVPDPSPALSFDDRRRMKVFLKDQIPTQVVSGGYLALAFISIVAVPYIFPQLRFYHIAAAYIIAPVLAFCNAYGTGLTDWSLSASYGKLAIFIFGSWVGAGNGGVLAGLAACGVMMSIVSNASDLMQDLKTGYLTLSSPRSMFVSQVIGTAMGCVVSPIVFFTFYRAFPLGQAGSEYPAPYAKLYRGIALLGVEGFRSLPRNCVGFCIAFFALGIGINVVREVAKMNGWRVQHYVPSAMGMAVPFYLGSYISIDMCVGSLILAAWESLDKQQADMFVPAVASGMICGDGIWSLPSSLLALTKVQPPVCMRFLSRHEAVRVDKFLARNSTKVSKWVSSTVPGNYTYQH